MFSCLPRVSGSCTFMNSVVPECLFSQVILSSPFSTFAFLHGDTGDSPTRPYMSELFVSLQISTSLGLFLFSKEQAKTVSTYPWILKHDWQSHTPAVFFLNLHSHVLVDSPIYTGKEVRWKECRAGKEDRKCSSEWKDSSDSKRETWSTDPQGKTRHRNRGMSSANKNVCQGLFFMAWQL